MPVVGSKSESETMKGGALSSRAVIQVMANMVWDVGLRGDDRVNIAQDNPNCDSTGIGIDLDSPIYHPTGELMKRILPVVLMLAAIVACQSEGDTAAEQAQADSLITTLDAGADSLEVASDSLDAALDSLDTIGE